jgi:hypothetical protein
MVPKEYSGRHGWEELEVGLGRIDEKRKLENFR